MFSNVYVDQKYICDITNENYCTILYSKIFSITFQFKFHTKSYQNHPHASEPTNPTHLSSDRNRSAHPPLTPLHTSLDARQMSTTYFPGDKANRQNC